MRILHYIPSIDRDSGGVGAYMQMLARDLGKLCDLHVLTHPSENEVKLENCTIHYIPYKWLPWNNCKEDFLSIVTWLKPDVFHTNCCWMPVSAFTALWTAKLRNENVEFRNLKIVYSPHGMLEPYAIKRHYWWKKLPAILLFQRKGVAICDWIHATADTEKNNLLRLDWNKNVFVVPNCVQIDNIQVKSSWKRTHNMLFLSRIHPKKGIEFLIEAVARLKDKLSGYRVIIAGEGDESYVCQLKSLAKQLKVDNLVEFIGAVFEERKWQLYQSADVFVLPTYSENFGIVVAESLATGTPVITTFGTPWKELNDLHCGWCTDIGTNPLVEALEKFLLCDERELEIIGRNGRKLVESKYSSLSVAQKFIEKYQDLCQKQI